MPNQHELGTLILERARKQKDQEHSARIQKMVMMPGMLQQMFKNKGSIPVVEPSPDYEAVGDVNTDNVTAYPLENPSIDVSKIMKAIGQFESSGNYGSIGVPTKSGDRAYGKYQIMGANIPSWSQQALGRQIGVDEFMGNPSLQDAIAQFQMQKYYDKYRNPNDVASMWFSGRPSRMNTRKDVLGTTVPQYIAGVNRYL